MARLKLRDDDMCWSCHKKVGTMLHMLHNCDIIKDLWEKTVSFINELFNISLIKSPALCMLGIIPKELRMHGLNRQWCRMAMLTGCRIIVRQWKTTTPSSFEHWIEVMSNTATYEQVIFRLSGRQDLFLKTWSPFLDYINNGQYPRTETSPSICT